MTTATKLTYASPDDPFIKSVMIKSIERLTGQRKLQKMYGYLLDRIEEESDFWEAALSELRLKLDYNEAQLAKIPRGCPVLFIANHPYGVLDGLIICHLATKSRRRFKILIHSALCREERIEPYLLPIDFSGTAESIQTNINSKNEALKTLRQGGAIVIFPAGGISTAKRPLGQATDLDWKLFAAKLIQMTQATVVPIYFHGQNSPVFQLVSQFSSTLRLSLIIHEVKNKIGKTIRVTIGDPIPFEQLAGIKGRQNLTDHLRQLTYELKYRS